MPSLRRGEGLQAPVAQGSASSPVPREEGGIFPCPVLLQPHNWCLPPSLCAAQPQQQIPKLRLPTPRWPPSISTQTVGLGCWQHSNNNSFHFDSAHCGPCARHTGLERNQSKQSRPQGDTWPRCNMSLSFLICEKKKIVISLAGLVGRTAGDTGREHGV